MVSLAPRMMPFIAAVVFCGWASAVGGAAGPSMLHPIKKGGLYGYIDGSGKVVVEPRFAEAWDFQDGMGRFREVAQTRARTLSGPTILGFVDCTGKIGTFRYAYARDYSDGLAVVSLDGDTVAAEGAVSFMPRGGGAYIDREGRVVLRRIGEDADYSEGLALSTWRALPSGEIGGSNGLIFRDRSGAVALALPDRWLRAGRCSEGLIRAMYVPPRSQQARDPVSGDLVWPDGRWGFFDRAGKKVIPPRFWSARDFRDGMAAVQATEPAVPRDGLHALGRWGFVDRTGKLAVAHAYEEVGDFGDGLARAKLPERYRDEDGIVGEKRKEDPWLFVDKAGKAVISGLPRRPGNFSEGLAGIFGRDGEYYADTTGKATFRLYVQRGVTVEPRLRYDIVELGDFRGGLARIILKDRDRPKEEIWAYVDRAGSVVWSSEPVLSTAREEEKRAWAEAEKFSVPSMPAPVLAEPSGRKGSIVPRKVPTDFVDAHACSPDGKIAFRMTARGFEIQDAETFGALGLLDRPRCGLDSHWGFFSDDGKFLALALEGGDMQGPKRILGVWDVASRRQMCEIDGVGRLDIRSARFAPGAGRVFIGGPSAAVSIWDSTTGAKIREFRAVPDGGAVIFTPDCRRALILQVPGGGFYDAAAKAMVKPRGGLVCVDLETGAELYRNGGAAMSGGEISSDGRRLVGWMKNQSLVCDVETGKVLQAIEGTNYESPVISWDGRHVLFQPSNGRPFLMVVETGARLAVLHTTLGEVRVRELLTNRRDVLCHAEGHGSVGQLFRCALPGN